MCLNIPINEDEVGYQALGWRLDSARLSQREAGNEASAVLDCGNKATPNPDPSPGEGLG